MTAITHGKLGKLPLEIREKIYGYLLVDDYLTARLCCVRLRVNDPGNLSLSPINIGIFLVSKHIHEEAKATLYRSSCMTIRLNVLCSSGDKNGVFQSAIFEMGHDYESESRPQHQEIQARDSARRERLINH